MYYSAKASGTTALDERPIYWLSVLINILSMVLYEMGDVAENEHNEGDE